MRKGTSAVASPIVEILRNLPQFEDDASAVRDDLYRAISDALRLAIRDPKLQRHDLRVLAAVSERTSDSTGTSWIGRSRIATQEGMQEKTVENSLFKLRSRGFLRWEKRSSPENHDGRLFHYVLRTSRLTRDVIRAQLEIWCQERTSGTEKPIAGHGEKPIAQHGEKPLAKRGEKPKIHCPAWKPIAQRGEKSIAGRGQY